MIWKIKHKLKALKKIFKNSLRLKIIIFCSFMLFLTVLISIILMNTMGKTILRDQIFFDLSAVAKSKSDHVVSIIKQDFERVALIASRTQLRRNIIAFDNASDNHSLEEIRAGIIKILKDAKNSVSALKYVEIINKDGIIIAGTDSIRIGQEEKNQELFQQGLQKDYQGRFKEKNGQFTHIIALPLIHPDDGNENKIGVVKVKLSLERIIKILTDRTGLRKTGELIMISSINNQYIAMNPLRHTYGKALKAINTGLKKSIRMATSGYSGFLQEIDYRGVSTFTAFSPVPLKSKEWGLIVKLDAEEAFEPMRTLQRIFVSITGIVWILASIAIYINISRATAPVKKLFIGTKKLGEGDLKHRIDVTSQDELGVLTSSFNKMAEKLLIITASRDELEHEVAERINVEKQLKKTKELAEAANIAKSEFLAKMSHEIRTPLNGVIGFTDLLKSTPLSPIQQQYVNNANVSGHTLLEIINNILDFSKIEADMLQLEMIKIDMIELLENSVDIIKFNAAEKNLELLLHIDPDMPRSAITDPIRLKQILVNLLGNAVKFTEKGEVELKVTYQKLDSEKGKLCFSVRDTGIGINEEQQGKLFKSFTQADNSTTRKFGGTGLGLVISDLLAQKMGSKIKIESKYGEGTKFYFDIITDTEEGEKLNKGSIEKIKRCLIIDDNANNRFILEEMLSNWDINNESCGDGLTAMKLLETSEPFDIIICDYNMPYIDGLETIRMIRQKLKLTPQKQPIILLHSSADDAELHKQSKDLGVRFMLTKPVKARELYLYLCQVYKSEQKEYMVKFTDDDNKEIKDEFFKGSNVKILIAEDVPMNMAVIKRFLRKILPDADLIEANNGLKVLKLNKQIKLDLIFMDVHMPEIDGIEATREIRALEKNSDKHIPIVALTAGAFKEDQKRCLDSGMDNFMTKPVKLDKIKNILEKYIVDKKNNHDNNRFSKETLLDGVDSDEDIKDLIAIALEEFPEKMNKLGVFIKEGNIEGIQKLEHNIKGAALNMGWNTIAQIAIEMGKMTNDDENLSLLKEKYKELQAEWKIVKDLMQK
ncbi:MAG: response regulator [Candidatus Muiribacteriota bacterium]